MVERRVERIAGPRRGGDGITLATLNPRYGAPGPS
jgi:hypothetical protein